jgi:hypothetical protein
VKTIKINGRDSCTVQINKTWNSGDSWRTQAHINTASFTAQIINRVSGGVDCGEINNFVVDTDKGQVTVSP